MMNPAPKIRIRHILLIVLVAFIIAARADEHIGEWYATGLYPVISAGLSFLVSWIPFSMTELLVVCAIVLMALILIKGIRKKQAFWKIILKEAELMIWVFIWLYLGWGINYFRESIYTRGDIERHAYDEVIFKKFITEYADSLNASYTPDIAEMAEYENNIKSIYSSVPENYGLCSPKGWQHPKRLIFNRLYTSVGVGGYIGPFFCETHINADLLPAQQPFSYAHELSHLLGVSNEDEANFWAYETCRKSGIPAIRYSGYYSLLPYVLSNAVKVLAEDEYKDYVNTIKPEILQQLIEQQKFWKSKYNKTLGKIQSAVYDSMLKANKISSGTKNYSQVIELIIANEYENY